MRLSSIPATPVSLLLILLLSVPAIGQAEETQVSPPSPGEPPAASKPESAGPAISLAPGKGLTVQSADGRFSFGVRARMQLRDTYTQLPASNTNEVQVR